MVSSLQIAFFYFENVVIDIRELERQQICSIQVSSCSLLTKKREDGVFTYAVELNKKRITSWSFLTNAVTNMKELANEEQPICNTTPTSACRISAQKMANGQFSYSVKLNNEQITEWSFLENTIEKRNILVSYNICTS